MKGKHWVKWCLTVAAVAAATAQEAARRTAWGDPDLSGTYASDNSIGVPLERPTQFGTRAELTDEEYAARVNANDVSPSVARGAAAACPLRTPISRTTIAASRAESSARSCP